MTGKSKKSKKTIKTLTHEEATRRNIPTAEYESVMENEDRDPIAVAYERRNRDLDPQLVWRGKDVEGWSDLIVPAPPLFIQEKVHPKVLVDDLSRRSKVNPEETFEQFDLFADFDGVSSEASSTEFYEHEANWSNRMILGDSLQVMGSLAEREGLRGKVQCIYFDPPYGIKFNSNFQWSTTSRDVKDGKSDHITREPEQVKAFRDTWRDGIHSYMTYLRDRLTVARDLLSPTGSIFLQIGDENVHRVRSVLDEVFGTENFIAEIIARTTTSSSSKYVDTVNDYVLWYARSAEETKYRPAMKAKGDGSQLPAMYTNVQLADGSRRRLSKEERSNAEVARSLGRVFRIDQLTSQTQASTTKYDLEFEGAVYPSGKRQWATPISGMQRLIRAGRVSLSGTTPSYVRFIDDYPVTPIANLWTDTSTGGFTDSKVYVVQTASKIISRCILMASDPGDLVLDPTCGSGTTAFVAEQHGRRWITIDTSRVALALARARIMGARYPYYLLTDSEKGRARATEDQRTPTGTAATNSLRQGFIYERVPHVTLKSIANNSEIDAIWEKWQEKLTSLLTELNSALGSTWSEWEVPSDPSEEWTDDVKRLHEAWDHGRHARQAEIDASIAAKADFQYLYDKPLEDKNTVRVAGPFTVESLSPHRVVSFDDEDQLVDPLNSSTTGADGADFGTIILENLETAGVQQAHKEDKLNFLSVAPWPGKMIAGEGRYREGEKETAPEKRAAIFIGPEFGTVSRADLVEAAKEAGDADFDVLVACAFNFEAHASEFDQLGRVPVLKATMNADLHMADDLKNTGQGNLFVIFGEPDIEVFDAVADDAEEGQLQVRVNGVDVFDPSSGEVRSDGADGIACWFVDTDYNEESFFVRQAYFLGANDPYKALKTTLKAEIDKEAWDSLNSETSRPFDRPDSGRIAVKVINHLGDEVMKVCRVS